MFSVNDTISSIKANLEEQSDLLIENLKEFFSYNFSSEIDLLEFTAFIEPTRFELSIRVFSMDQDANEVFDEGNDTMVFAGSKEILRDIQYYQLKDNKPADFFDFYEQNEDTLSIQEQQAFSDWFSQCWEKAGGSALHLPSFFIFHDDSQSFDLKNKQWVDDEEKWS